MSHMVSDGDDYTNSKNISDTIYMIEKNDLEGVKRYVPRLVKPTDRSARLKIQIIDIARHMKRDGIVNYFENIIRTEAEKRVAKFDECFANMELIRIAIASGDIDTVQELFRYPDSLFCSDDKRTNEEQLETYRRLAEIRGGEMNDFVTYFIPTLKKRSRKFFR